MKRLHLVIVLLLCILFLSSGMVFAENVNPLQRVICSGDIKGVVEPCTLGVPAMVYIVGKSFMVKTGPDGEFRIYNVPRGTYELMIEVSGEEPVSITGIKVKCRKVTDLGVVAACSGGGGNDDECAEGLNDCEGECVDLATDRNNCGQCGIECSLWEICVNGECVWAD